MSNLKAVADDVFARFPDKGKVYVTSDGQAFIDESHARNHAVNNRSGRELKMETFLREKSPSKSSKSSKSKEK
jgi:hypothetical protein